MVIEVARSKRSIQQQQQQQHQQTRPTNNLMAPSLTNLSPNQQLPVQQQQQQPATTTTTAPSFQVAYLPTNTSNHSSAATAVPTAASVSYNCDLGSVFNNTNNGETYYVVYM
eukprot:PhM_4_TR18820/c4_g1_i1/m.95845